MSLAQWKWKKMAKRATKEDRTTECSVCNDPIIPGDIVAKAENEDAKKEGLTHAGFHIAITGRTSFCTNSSDIIGYWDGSQVKELEESLTVKAIRARRSLLGRKE